MSDDNPNVTVTQPTVDPAYRPAPVELTPDAERVERLAACRDQLRWVAGMVNHQERLMRGYGFTTLSRELVKEVAALPELGELANAMLPTGESQ